MRRAIAVLLALAAFAFATRVSAQNKAACASSYEQAQRLRKRGELVAARGELVTCSRECSAALQHDCVEWLADVEKTVPSIVVVARDGAGADVADVRLIVDGKPVASSLDGKAIELDPGKHALRFERANGAIVEQTLLLREAERGRVVQVDFPAEAKSSQPPPPPPPPTHEEAQETRAPVPWYAWALGGVAVLGLGSFGYFALTGTHDQSTRLDPCKPDCTQSDIDRVHGKYVIADVSLAVSVVALGAAVIVILTRPTIQVTHASR